MIEIKAWFDSEWHETSDIVIVLRLMINIIVYMKRTGLNTIKFI
jgi:hypothetical protein